MNQTILFIKRRTIIENAIDRVERQLLVFTSDNINQDFTITSCHFKEIQNFSGRVEKISCLIDSWIIGYFRGKNIKLIIIDEEKPGKVLIMNVD